MKRPIRHFKRWNKWRKRCMNSRWYKFFVLIGLYKSPTLMLTLTDEEEDEVHRAFLRALGLDLSNEKRRKRMKFYVNQFYGDRLGGGPAGFRNIYPNNYIGLFTQCETRGEGSFCGYYGAEYYLNTELLAYYEAEGLIYRPEKRISQVYPCYFRRSKILIGSHMWTQVIEANSIEKALKKFENADWRQWRSPEDEYSRCNEHDQN